MVESFGGSASLARASVDRSKRDDSFLSIDSFNDTFLRSSEESLERK